LKAKGKSPTKRNRSLPLEAAIQYGLIEKETYIATDLARKLIALNSPAMYDEFARHILLNCGGLRVLDGIRQMEIDQIPVTGDSLAEYLTSQGFNVSVHNTAINSLRLWLAWAGIFASKRKGKGCWTIVDEGVKRLLGFDEDTLAELAGLDEHHLAFVDALCAIGPKARYVASDVRDVARGLHPAVKFDSGSLPQDVLQPLKEAGLIDYVTRGTASGKSSTLTLTPQFDAKVLHPFVTRTVKDLDAAISVYFKKRPEDIYADLESPTNTVKGRALEALAIRLMRLLKLRFIAWNNRAKNTGWGEVDAVFAGVFGAVPTRWQIQCKNTPGSEKVDLEDIAKEVGLVPITRATHVLFLANNDFTSEAIKYADQIMYNAGLTIFMLGRSEFEQLRRDDAVLVKILRAKANEIVRKVPSTSVFAWKKKT
jgi:site-specific DNA-methyltransferase (cytosine-N4-specific)